MSKEVTFIGEHTQYCTCGYREEPMAESIVKYKNEEWLERTCKGCGRTFKVARWNKC